MAEWKFVNIVPQGHVTSNQLVKLLNALGLSQNKSVARDIMWLR